jgi:hypothetical protein
MGVAQRDDRDSVFFGPGDTKQGRLARDNLAVAAGAVMKAPLSLTIWPFWLAAALPPWRLRR